jgi:glycosyltransferase involved in cell wall biosynthesis
MGGMSFGLIETARRRGLPAVGVVGDEWMRWGPKADLWQRPFYSLPALAPAAERATGLPARVDLAGAALWLFNSEAVQRASGAPPRSRIVHPGIDHQLFAEAPDHDWAWRLLYLGRMDPRKGVDIAVQALDHLPPEATLTLQGSGDPAYVDSLRRERVRFAHEPRERLPEVYAAADVVLFPVQWDEPWGLVPLEAMAVGRPVVASGTGGSREYLRHEENCLLYEPRDSAEGLAQAIARLAGDAELRARLGRAARESVERLSLERIVELEEEVLERAVQARARA